MSTLSSSKNVPLETWPSLAGFELKILCLESDRSLSSFMLYLRDRLEWYIIAKLTHGLSYSRAYIFANEVLACIML